MLARKSKIFLLAVLAIMVIVITLCIIVGVVAGALITKASAEEITPIAPVVIARQLNSQIIIPTPVPSVEEVKPRYGFTDDDIYILAQMLCGSKDRDGDGEYDIDFQKEVNYYEISKVLAVVMNRVRSNKFPNTVREVLLQRGQFSVMPANLEKTPSDRALQVVAEWCTAYDTYDPGVQVCPEEHLYFTGNGWTNTTR